MVLEIPIGTQTLVDSERQIIEATLIITGGNKTLSAKLLGICAKTIYNKQRLWKREDKKRKRT